MAEKTDDQETPPDVKVVDAEIVEDSEPPRADAAEPKTIEAAMTPKQSSGRAGWVVAGLLAAFSGGLIAAPYAEQGLRTIGLLAPLETSPTSDSQAPDLQPAIDALETRAADLALAVERHQEILAQHEQGLAAAATAREQLGNDVALMAGQAANGGADILPDSELAAVRARLAALTDEVARLATLSAAESPEVAGLTGAVALARAEAAQLKSQLETLENTVAELQAGSLEVSPKGRMLVAIGRLKDQAIRGMAFGAELVALRAEIAVMPALDQQMIGADVALLARHPNGVRPYEALVRDFAGAASAAKRAQEKQDGSLLANLFTVRRTDDGATGIDAVLLDAERRLLARDVAGALEALAPLTGEAAEATALWREAATAHQEVTDALDRLQRTIAGSNSTPSAGGRR